MEREGISRAFSGRCFGSGFALREYWELRWTSLFGSVGWLFQMELHQLPKYLILPTDFAPTSTYTSSVDLFSCWTNRLHCLTHDSVQLTVLKRDCWAMWPSNTSAALLNDIKITQRCIACERN